MKFETLRKLFQSFKKEDVEMYEFSVPIMCQSVNEETRAEYLRQLKEALVATHEGVFFRPRSFVNGNIIIGGR